MENETYKDFKKEGHHRHRGPKTFRRGRAIAFLERMNLKRTTLKQQLEQPEFQPIHQVLLGELKAIDMVINEFTQLFDLNEMDAAAEKEEGKSVKKPMEGGSQSDETN